MCGWSVGWFWFSEGVVRILFNKWILTSPLTYLLNMYSLSFKLILLTTIVCFLQVHGSDDKNTKNLKTDLKAKYAKAQVATEAVDSSTESEHLDTESISVLGISVPPGEENDTIQFDHHTYYNSTFYADPEVAKQFWIDLNTYPTPIIHEMLSNSHRQATTVDLTFEFPFYGSPLKNLTIATGGFLYTGDYLHNWIAATQYVAPLMANFDTSQSPDSLIKYADNGTAFTVEWDNVFIKNRMTDGAFKFQVTLLKSGDIIFAYKEIPYQVSNISDSSHPVKIGLSDAYVLERSLFFVRRKTIYEYHRVDMLQKKIANNTALYFTALPTCLDFKNCNSCLSALPSMECMWCGAAQRCSDGVDRLRQSWITNGCTLNIDKTCNETITVLPDKTQESTSVKSPVINPNFVETSTKYTEKLSTSKHSEIFDLDHPAHNSLLPQNSQESAHFIQQSESISASSVSVGAIVTIVIFIAVVLSALGWMGYAYKFPQSSSGQFLIKYRPSQWALRKDDNSVTTSSRHL